MEEKFLELRAKIESLRKKNSHKKILHYPKDLRSEILSFLKDEGMSVSDFCKRTGFSFSTLNQWIRFSLIQKSCSKILEKESSFKPVSIKKESEKRVYILKGLSFDEICDLIGEL